MANVCFSVLQILRTLTKNSQRKCFVFSCGNWKSRKTGHYNSNTFHFYSSIRILLAFNIHSFHIWFDIWMSQRALRSKKSSIWKCNERQSSTFWFFLLTMLFYTNQDLKRKIYILMMVKYLWRLSPHTLNFFHDLFFSMTRISKTRTQRKNSRASKTRRDLWIVQKVEVGDYNIPMYNWEYVFCQKDHISDR